MLAITIYIHVHVIGMCRLVSIGTILARLDLYIYSIRILFTVVYIMYTVVKPERDILKGTIDLYK